MSFGTEGKVVVVTGATRGIGRATAFAFARHHARVIITYHSRQQEAESVVNEVTAAGGEAVAVRFELGRRAGLEHVVDTALTRWGRVDVLVNNAVDWEPLPQAWRGLFEDCPVDRWRPRLRANIEGTYTAIQSVLPPMRRQGWGRIVNVSSAAAADGMEGFGWYAAAKSALHGLTRTVAREVGPDGILVNIVMPGATLTEQVQQNVAERTLARHAASLPIRRIPSPEEVAEVILFLGSARNTVVTGEVIRASGGCA
jgi:3-oxoacyl-[acyl-carrier protein] reductase